MAEALVSVLLERLATVALDKVREEFKLVSGVGEEVKSLARNLEAIQAVLEDAEQRQVTEATVRRWLSELTEVSYEIDDVLDEWITRVRKRQMKKEEKHVLAIAEKVRSTASSFISGSKVRRFIHRREMAGRIKELKERLALIMNGLEPHPGLESLYISWYAGGAFSHWLSYLHSLRVLTFWNCPNCGILPPLGKLASLESLKIEALRGVSKVGVEFLGIDDGQTSSSSNFISFPNLKQLSFNYMWSWKEWVGVENNITIMPCLSQFTIENCKKLKALPDFLWKTPLQKLHISYSPILPRSLQTRNR